MSEVTYEIVEHDGGWAYKVDGALSRCSRPMRQRSRQHRPPPLSRKPPARPKRLNTKTRKGKWHTETARGSDRPETHIKDKE